MMINEAFKNIKEREKQAAAAEQLRASAAATSAHTAPFEDTSGEQSPPSLTAAFSDSSSDRSSRDPSPPIRAIIPVEVLDETGQKNIPDDDLFRKTPVIVASMAGRGIDATSTRSPQKTYFNSPLFQAYITYFKERNLSPKVGIADHLQIWNILRAYFPGFHLNHALSLARDLSVQISKAKINVLNNEMTRRRIILSSETDLPTGFDELRQDMHELDIKLHDDPRLETQRNPLPDMDWEAFINAFAPHLLTNTIFNADNVVLNSAASTDLLAKVLEYLRPYFPSEENLYTFLAIFDPQGAELINDRRGQDWTSFSQVVTPIIQRLTNWQLLYTAFALPLATQIVRLDSYLYRRSFKTTIIDSAFGHHGSWERAYLSDDFVTAQEVVRTGLKNGSARFDRCVINGSLDFQTSKVYKQNIHQAPTEHKRAYEIAITDFTRIYQITETAMSVLMATLIDGPKRFYYPKPWTSGNQEFSLYAYHATAPMSPPVQFGVIREVKVSEVKLGRTNKQSKRLSGEIKPLLPEHRASSTPIPVIARIVQQDDSMRPSSFPGMPVFSESPPSMTSGFGMAPPVVQGAPDPGAPQKSQAQQQANATHQSVYGFQSVPGVVEVHHYHHTTVFVARPPMPGDAKDYYAAYPTMMMQGYTHQMMPPGVNPQMGYHAIPQPAGYPPQIPYASMPQPVYPPQIPYASMPQPAYPPQMPYASMQPGYPPQMPYAQAVYAVPTIPKPPTPDAWSNANEDEDEMQTNDVPPPPPDLPRTADQPS